MSDRLSAASECARERLNVLAFSLHVVIDSAAEKEGRKTDDRGGGGADGLKKRKKFHYEIESEDSMEANLKPSVAPILSSSLPPSSTFTPDQGCLLRPTDLWRAAVRA